MNITSSSIHRTTKWLSPSLGWLTRNLDYFDPCKNRNAGSHSLQAAKAFAELAVCYHWLDSWRLKSELLASKTSFQRTLLGWRNFIVERCETATFAEMARKYPSQAFPLVLPYLMLRASGVRLKYQEETLWKLHSCGYPSADEVVPYRALDRQYFLWKSGWLDVEPNWNSLYERTILGRAKRISHLSVGDAYSITHTVFYITDFGLNALPPELASERSRIEHLVSGLLVHYWRLGNWDLVGELLINLHNLRASKSFAYHGASKAFRQAWLKNGAVPPSDADAPSPELRSNSEASAETGLDFERHYHTTLVGSLFCATAAGLAEC